MGLSTLCSVALAANEKGSGSAIVLAPLFVDSESGILASTEGTDYPGSFTEFYTNDSLLYRTEYITYEALAEPDAPGTFYVYRFGMRQMDGETMGYNHMGNGSFFMPTILIPASQTPELNWLNEVPIDYDGVSMSVLNFIADSTAHPSVALSNSLSGYVISGYQYRLFIEYLPGNTLHGNQSYTFPKGGAGELAGEVWGAPYNPASDHVYFGTSTPIGPMNVSYGFDDYTTVTLQYNGELRKYHGRSVVFRPTTGLSATGFLDGIGYTPSPPPKWIVKMAVEQKLSGKTKWLYWPLDRYADVNGDGVIDAADLIALDRMKELKAGGPHD